MTTFSMILSAIIVGAIIVTILFVSREMQKRKMLSKNPEAFKAKDPAYQAEPAGVKLDQISEKLTGNSKAVEDIQSRVQAKKQREGEAESTTQPHTA